jgi:outer membrane protein OmpA-like peptidoglycan-associated protein
LRSWFKIALLFLGFYGMSAQAQDFVNENSYFECDQAFEIGWPLSIKNDPTVFYQYEEQFSFWYRFKTTVAEEITFELTSLDSNSVYTVFVYETSGKNLCSKVFNAKVKPLKETLLNKESTLSGLITHFTLKVKPSKAYYFCVLNTSVYNCGHQLKITSITESIVVKAVHIPCVINEVKEVEKVKELPLGIDNLLAIIKLKDQFNEGNNITAEISIKDLGYNSEIKIDYDSTKTNSLLVERGKKYAVSCVAPGYQRFSHELIISDYMLTDSSDFIIYLKPLKQGDIFLMNHIYFHPNTYALKREANKELDYLVNFLFNNKTLEIELSGHTNGNNKIKRNKAFKKRSEQWNFDGTSKQLSMFRAKEIKRKLVRKGIDENRIYTKGYGGDKMIIKEAKVLEAIEKNIRVEIKIM